MELSNIEFNLKWHQNIQLNNLRQYIIDNISKRGEVLRWSIDHIKIEEKQSDTKILIISAVIITNTNFH